MSSATTQLADLKEGTLQRLQHLNLTQTTPNRTNPFPVASRQLPAPPTLPQDTQKKAMTPQEYLGPRSHATGPELRVHFYRAFRMRSALFLEWPGSTAKGRLLRTVVERNREKALRSHPKQWSLPKNPWALHGRGRTRHLRRGLDPQNPVFEGPDS